jgi:hypothetical protein
MNRILIGSFLVGSMVLVGSYGSLTAEAGISASVTVPPAVVTPVALANAPAAAEEVYPHIELHTVNGISLYDDAAGVLATAGAPDRIAKDSMVKGLNLFEYPGMKIGVADGMTAFVSVPGTAKTILLDGTAVPLTLEALKKALGEPDFTAEDGLVFQRSERLLKIFLDPGTGKIKSVDYYSMSNA